MIILVLALRTTTRYDMNARVLVFLYTTTGSHDRTCISYSSLFLPDWAPSTSKLQAVRTRTTHLVVVLDCTRSILGKADCLLYLRSPPGPATWRAVDCAAHHPTVLRRRWGRPILVLLYSSLQSAKPPSRNTFKEHTSRTQEYLSLVVFVLFLLLLLLLDVACTDWTLYVCLPRCWLM